VADLITLEQFEVRTGLVLTPTQTAQVEALITDASALVVDIAADPDVTGTWTSATVPPAVVPVVVSMVRRGFENPHGFTQETTPGYSYSGASGNGIFATRDEARTIRRAAGSWSTIHLDGYLPGAGATSWLRGAL
jgi:hypothetical protein